MSERDFTLTRNEIVREAFRDIGVLDEANPTLTAEQLAVGVTRLNLIVSNLQSRGIFLWTETDHAITLTGAESYELPSDVIGVRMAWYNKKPIRRVSLEDYRAKPDTVGEPEVVAVYAEDGLLRVCVWPKASSGELVCRVERRLKDFDRFDSQLDAPNWFMRPLIKILAADLGRSYGIPLDVILDLRREGYALFEEGLHKTEDSEDISVIGGYYA